ncbi:ThuA domain-containing protein [Ruania rhizosphaerae]|uniref:ThuA domain-containing protein n=1 Tax=Ruania rhizosphaerae TaxID=1840413 RepID=UPI001359BFE5|nr:ThuA domain-containing protein [Ruania rhizosphaerae]
MADVRVLSGAGRYADPYHAFPDTTKRLEQLLHTEGHRVEVTEEVETGLADLRGVDLLVVNVGKPAESEASSARDAAALGLRDHIARGGALLAVHVSATSFPGMDAWEECLGGRWVAGQSMHPPHGLADVVVHTGTHPIVEETPDFTVWDERYSFLRYSPDVHVLAHHVHDGVQHPLLWALEHGHRQGRVVYSALGHDVRSYDSEEHLEILRQSTRWLLHETA